MLGLPVLHFLLSLWKQLWQRNVRYSHSVVRCSRSVVFCHKPFDFSSLDIYTIKPLYTVDESLTDNFVELLTNFSQFTVESGAPATEAFSDPRWLVSGKPWQFYYSVFSIYPGSVGNVVQNEPLSKDKVTRVMRIVAQNCPIRTLNMINCRLFFYKICEHTNFSSIDIVEQKVFVWAIIIGMNTDMKRLYDDSNRRTFSGRGSFPKR